MSLAASAYLCICAAVCAGVTVSTRENHVFGFTPFHSVIEICVFALIIHPETTEGVNPCPVMEPKGSKGRVWCCTVLAKVSFVGEAEHLAVSDTSRHFY